MTLDNCKTPLVSIYLPCVDLICDMQLKAFFFHFSFMLLLSISKSITRWYQVIFCFDKLIFHALRSTYPLGIYANFIPFKSFIVEVWPVQSFDGCVLQCGWYNPDSVPFGTILTLFWLIVNIVVKKQTPQ